MTETLGLWNYRVAIFLLVFGLYILITEKNLARKIFGMVTLQIGVIVFYLSLAFKHDAKIPIVDAHLVPGSFDAVNYANPLPQALMLTAIVVGVSTLGVALVLMVSIYRKTKSLEEDEILKKINS